MAERENTAGSAPEFSVVIAAYNDWGPLNECLRSLAEQRGAPSFEVVVVDDGSRSEAPEFIRAWSRHYPLSVARQEHAGIAAARNRGAQSARGATLISVDADCKLEKDCLASLAVTLAEHPQRNYFQLHIVGDCARLVGRAEELRLIVVQSHLRQPDGCIRYMNTAGFAMRRTKGPSAEGLFDPAALRGEDTLFLAHLMQSGELPWFAEKAVVQHAIPLNLLQCCLKDIRTAYLEAGTYDAIAAMGVRVRVTHRERVDMLRSTWRTAAQGSIGRTAWLVLLVRQVLRLVVLKLAQVSGLRVHSRVAAKSS
ncbi:MAG TPA: glycosyltransferase family A protein [Candidatus Acidoferrum sp.]|nr:glycosyltransferase family A protein [Candidatus Acidoferrum sp.]